MTVRRAFCLLAIGIVLSPAISTATTLTGVVVDAEKSTPILNAIVSVDVLIPDSVTFNTASDSMGMYSLSGIPGGNAIYVVRCWVYGFAPFYMRYDALALGDRQVDILMYPEQTVPPGGGGDSTVVSGAVFHELSGGARNPVGLATVTLRGAGSEVAAQTGVDGKYSMHVRRGSYTVHVAAANYETLTAGGVGVDSTGLVLNVFLKSTAVSVSQYQTDRVESFRLENAYPNPFNPKTVVSSRYPVASEVRLVVYDLLGREVAVLVNERRDAGSYRDVFDASGLASGVYLYRLTAGAFTQTRTMVLAK